MNRFSQDFNIPDRELFKEKALNWAQQYKEAAWLDSNAYPHLYHTFDAVLAINASTYIKTDTHNVFNKLRAYRETAKDWIFGYFSYDLKNDIEKLASANSDELGFPDMYFFQPEKIIFITGNTVTFSYLPSVRNAIEDDFREIASFHSPDSEINQTQQQLSIIARLQKNEYLECVRNILARIQRGDIYEANFCLEFYARATLLNPLTTYKKLNAISRAPFSAYLRLKDNYLLAASPERYLKKEGLKIISQPIKGTSRRSSNSKKDNTLKTALGNSPKERAENIMIVDLVRNDLSKIARKGSVLVEELCKVYTFQQLHHMISTITCIAKDKTDPLDIIKATFPMGSMTGAPKISAMKIIEKQEVSRRGLYSGAMGYFSPEGDFDFNVVIRSILYNAAKKYVSFSVGSAITAKSSPEGEYEECLAKAAAMKQVLAGKL